MQDGVHQNKLGSCPISLSVVCIGQKGDIVQARYMTFQQYGGETNSLVGQCVASFYCGVCTLKCVCQLTKFTLKSVETMQTREHSTTQV
jgi:hypothetical protein